MPRLLVLVPIVIWLLRPTGDVWWPELLAAIGAGRARAHLRHRGAGHRELRRMGQPPQRPPALPASTRAALGDSPAPPRHAAAVLLVRNLHLLPRRITGGDVLEQLGSTDRPGPSAGDRAGVSVLVARHRRRLAGRQATARSPRARHAPPRDGTAYAARVLPLVGARRAQATAHRPCSACPFALFQRRRLRPDRARWLATFR